MSRDLHEVPVAVFGNHARKSPSVVLTSPICTRRKSTQFTLWIAPLSLKKP